MEHLSLEPVNCRTLARWRLFDVMNRLPVKHLCLELLIAVFWNVTGK
jgi:hypothetical protein